jgi:hypothetical protein
MSFDDEIPETPNLERQLTQYKMDYAKTFIKDMKIGERKLIQQVDSPIGNPIFTHNYWIVKEKNGHRFEHEKLKNSESLDIVEEAKESWKNWLKLWSDEASKFNTDGNFDNTDIPFEDIDEDLTKVLDKDLFIWPKVWADLNNNKYMDAMILSVISDIYEDAYVTYQDPADMYADPENYEGQFDKLKDFLVLSSDIGVYAVKSMIGPYRFGPAYEELIKTKNPEKLQKFIDVLDLVKRLMKKEEEEISRLELECKKAKERLNRMKK